MNSRRLPTAAPSHFSGCVIVMAALYGVMLGTMAVSRAEALAASDTATLRLEHCLVSLIEDVDIPAERAGVLRALAVKEGDYVEKDFVLAEIDRAEAETQSEAAQAEAEAARVKAQSRLEVDHARVEHEVRLAEHRMSTDANRKEPNSVSLVELERLRLAAEQARLKILVAEQDLRLRAIESGGFDAKARQAAIDVSCRQVHAPVAGEIVETFFRPGEWVEPGKPLLRLVRLDRLRIEGFVSFDAIAPAKLRGAAVTARVVFAGGMVEPFAGTVTFVSPVVQPGGEYRIWAEVENRRVNDEWLLRPGVAAELTIAPSPPDAVGTVHPATSIINSLFTNQE